MAKTEKMRFFGFSGKRSTKIFFEGTEVESWKKFYGKQAQILERGKERERKAFQRSQKGTGKESFPSPCQGKGKERFPQILGK